MADKKQYFSVISKTSGFIDALLRHTKNIETGTQIFILVS